MDRAWVVVALTIGNSFIWAQPYTPPAGLRPPRVGLGMSILPGGRLILPLGEQHGTGAVPAGLALSPSGKTLVTVNLGGSRPSLTVLERAQTWAPRQLPGIRPVPSVTFSDEGWQTLEAGVAFSGEHAVFVAEGETGRVALIDVTEGERRRTLDLNQQGVHGSYSRDLVLDAHRGVLYVADLVNSRVAAFDIHSRQLIASVPVGGVPLALALSPDDHMLYVATGQSLINRRSSALLCAIDVSHVLMPKINASIPLHIPAGTAVFSIVATPTKLFVSVPGEDAVLSIDGRSRQVDGQIELRIPGLESLRGVLPAGLAYDSATGWLLVAEAGIDAVAVIDANSRKLLGHLPVGWSPTQVQVDRGTVYVLNEKGQGYGPSFRPNSATGSVSIFPLPAVSTLEASTRLVMRAAGLESKPGKVRPLPEAIRHVVLIVKNSRSYDEVLGDITRVSNGNVMGFPALARFGNDGYIDGRRERLSLHHLDVTPNHHAIAEQFAFEDNFYATADEDGEGVDTLTMLQHLAKHGISIYRDGGPFDEAVSDTEREGRLERELDSRYRESAEELPQFLLILLPNDHMGQPHPDAGYPYDVSYLADNDLALGRLLEYFSNSPWWRQMAVFVTEASAKGGRDHLDGRRTLLLCAGPWAKRNTVLHTNSNFAGLRKTIFRLLRVPPMNLSDASAADLSGCFNSTPNPAPYHSRPVDARLYDAQSAAHSAGGLARPDSAIKSR